MKILPDQAVGNSAEAAAGVSGNHARVRVASHAVAGTGVEKATSGSSNPVVPVQPDTNVTFRRDPNGRIYYVLTDGRSGKELQEIPPQQVRNVAQGIDEYLQEEAKSQAKPHVEVKA